jgi:hypothetical protein
MPNAPWRCLQCGTVNEPAATSCRSCGHWPSLFDLQDSAVGGTETSEREPAAPVVSPLEAPRPVLVMHDPHDVPRDVIESYQPDVDRTEDAPASPAGRRADRRQLVRLIIPIGLVLYLIISSYFSNR